MKKKAKRILKEEYMAFCSKAGTAWVDFDTWKKKKMEIEANRIARELLMPEKRFRKIWKRNTDIEKIARKFQVPVVAATLRGLELFGEYII